MLFNGWDNLFNTFIVGIISYSLLVFLLRVSGKRTLSKWNAFDFIVTIALGSSLATALLDKKVSAAEGVLGFALLIFLQLLVTWLSVRVNFFQKLIKAEPSLLMKDGAYLSDIMKKERVSASEIRAALREKGIADINTVKAVVLETDGSFSIISGNVTVDNSSLIDVKGFRGVEW